MFRPLARPPAPASARSAEKGLTRLFYCCDSSEELFPFSVAAFRSNSARDNLARFGCCVVPVLDTGSLAAWRSRVDAEHDRYPEFLRDSNGGDRQRPRVKVLGGFSAEGTASSFHNRTVRELRARYLCAVVESGLFSSGCVETFVDRLMRRHVGAAATAEAWHRDVSPKEMLSGADDQIFGGWINLDGAPQHFSFVPGSHLGVTPADLASGFSEMAKSTHAECRARSVVVQVPPGHAVVFPQHIVHEVVSVPAKRTMYRLFTGCRVTRAAGSAMHGGPDATRARLDRGEPMPLPSGQKPPLFSANHGSNFLQKPFRVIGAEAPGKFNLLGWSAYTFIDAMLETKQPGPTAKIGAPYRIVRRFAPSLADLGFRDRYPAYSEDEVAMYRAVPLEQALDLARRVVSAFSN